MRRFLVTVISLFFFTNVQSQLHDSGGHSLMRIKLKENEKMDKVQGSPYLEEEFRYGRIEFAEKEPLEVFMRYNAQRENIEIKVKKDDEEVYMLPIDKNTVYKIGRNTFKYDELNFEGNSITGYFLEHFNGNQFRLLAKPVLSVSEAVEARTGYDKDKPARMQIEQEYYIIWPNGKVENVRVRHRDIKKAFESKPARKYLSDNRIRSMEGLVSFISYMDEQ